MKSAIMQSTYLPKSGYLNLIYKTDIKLNYKDCETKRYEQNFNKNIIYTDKLTIIYALANLDWVETREYKID